MNQKPHDAAQLHKPVTQHHHPSQAAVQPVAAAVQKTPRPKRDIGLILAIIFASSVISGSLVFFGMQLGSKGGGSVDVDMIEKAFEGYAQKMQAKQQQDQQQAQTEKDKQAAEQAKNMPPVNIADEHVRGDRNATVTIVEYSDYECPYCKRVYPTLKQVVDSYGGKVNWVYRFYPLPFHEPMATKESEAGECAAALGGNDMFWKYTDLVYDRTTSNGNGLNDEALWQIGSDIGLNKAAFQACVQSGKYAQLVKDQTAGGDKAGVSGTPGNIIINNKTGKLAVVDGAQTFDTFKQAIDGLM